MDPVQLKLAEIEALKAAVKSVRTKLTEKKRQKSTTSSSTRKKEIQSSIEHIKGLLSGLERRGADLRNELHVLKLNRAGGPNV